MSVHDVSFVTNPELATGAVRSFVPIIRRCIAGGAWVHTISEHVAGQVRELFDAERVRVVYPGATRTSIAASPRPPLPGIDGRRYVLAIGMREPRKNLARLVDAFGLLHETHTDTALVLAGPSGPDDASHRRRHRPAVAAGRRVRARHRLARRRPARRRAGGSLGGGLPVARRGVRLPGAGGHGRRRAGGGGAGRSDPRGRGRGRGARRPAGAGRHRRRPGPRPRRRRPARRPRRRWPGAARPLHVVGDGRRDGLALPGRPGVATGSAA